MSVESSVPQGGTPRGAVFLSYASQDAEAARRIAEALRAAGVEVWFDQSELRGGDVWDHKIRRQIKSCALFVPIISRNALSRDEGYFRLEWKLAEDRTHLMAPGKAFIVPVVIDDAREDADELPDAFRRCQWTRLAEGKGSAEFVAQVDRLLNPVVAAPKEAPPPAANPLSAPNATTRSRRMLPMAAAGLLLLAILGVVFFRPSHSAPTEAASPGEAIPRIEQAIAKGDWESAYSLAKQIPDGSPDAIRLEYLWPQFSWITSIPSDPPGATVYRRPYNSAEDAWEKLGVTPLENIHFPFGLSRIRFEKEGYLPLERAIGGELVAEKQLPVGEGLVDLSRYVIVSEVFKLDTKDTLPAGKVRVPGRSMRGEDRTLELGDFFLGKYEVTNREYQQFVEAGGYQRREFWEHPFVRDGQPLSWEEAMKVFTDKTGRPGPSTWVGGTFPEGQDDFPVSGVSWYEAAACARFLGQELPTIYHWRRAFAPAMFPWLFPASNLEHKAPAKVGQFQGMGWAGTYDMAGNVREWLFNAVGEQRLILGAGASDPVYLASNTSYAQPPFDRSAINGFRLAITHDPAAVAAIARQPESGETVRDFRATPPVSDEVFDAYRRLFDYEAKPLDARIEESVDFPHWTRLRISVSAAYAGERLPIYLFLPHAAKPPLQAVLFWPGSGVRVLRSIDETSISLDFLIRSGRAVAQPVMDNTLDRRDPTGALSRLAYRDKLIRYVNDCRRTLDYLESRPDIDAGKLGYFGASWGGSHAPEALALEPRLRAAVLNVAGFFDGLPSPETDPVSYAPRVHVPVLMLNGEYDSVFPLETNARPFFDMLGTPAERKEFVVTPGGHFVPREILIGRTLDWFDKYLGQPVR